MKEVLPTLPTSVISWRAVKIRNTILKITVSKNYKWFVCSGVFYAVLVPLNACAMPAFTVLWSFSNGFLLVEQCSLLALKPSNMQCSGSAVPHLAFKAKILILIVSDVFISLHVTFFC